MDTSATPELSWAEARRIALRAQGLGGPRRTAVPPPRGSREALATTLERTHLLQIDSVSVFARAHHLPVYTRRGSWDPGVLGPASAPGPDRSLHESLAHEAAYATPEVHRLLGFRRRRAAERDWGAVREAATRSHHLLEDVHALLAEHGPLSAAAISRLLGDERRGEGWGWRRTDSQWVVEYLFRSGTLDCVGRNERFERLYLPAPHADPTGDALPEAPGAEETAAAVLGLVRLAARAHGIADLPALADYFRLRPADARDPVDTLVARGELREVTVRHPAGPRTMLLHHEAPAPRPLRTAALVSPFDPVVFFRPRLRDLFDVEYRIGIYTPAAKRTTGYYALPFLHGDRFPLRVDLKADRAAGVLRVAGVFPEPLPSLRRHVRAPLDADLAALAGELRRAARWQGLADVEVVAGEGRGELAGPLASHLAERPAAGTDGPDPAAG